MTLEDNITPVEKTHIEELKRRMKGLMNEESYEDDRLFGRFLRARKFNVDAAEEMLKKCLEWRKMNKMDTIISDYKIPEVIDKYIAATSFGCDKEGSPLIFSDFGNVDLIGLLKSVKSSMLVRYMTWMFEIDIRRMEESSVKHGIRVEKFTYIFNLENFSIRTATNKPTLEFMASIIGILDANYPERLKSAYFVNGSFYFTLFWSVLRSFIPGDTIKKAHIFGKDHWKEVLLENIDADVLPVFLGGDRKDPDGNPACKTIIKYGEMVPLRYFSTRKNSVFFLNPVSKKLRVARSSKAEVRLQVQHPNSMMEYEFEVKNKDILFSVLYVNDINNGTKREELIPKQRIETDVSSEAGILACEKPGIYILEFDNSYSWLHQKEIYYTASIVTEDSHRSSED